MKTATTIFLVVLALGLLITGCSKTSTTQTNTNVPTSTETNGAGDIVVDTTTANPDIGTLDDTAVSEDLPQ